uniref:Alkaline phosphatase n=1 Tax=Alexandrium catenella TaxID=2925 RepID=A0A0N7F1N8_ALECA|nr:alkaline phosphatase [Alexandrium catenella]
MAPSASLLSQVVAVLALTGPVLVAAVPRRLASTINFDSSGAPSSRPESFSMRSRVYVPYDANANGDSYAFGMGAAEQVAYDDIQKYLYAVSEQGAILVVDYSNPASPMVKDELHVSLAGRKLTDIEVCSHSGFFMIGEGAADTVSNGKVNFYSTVKRATPARPQQLHEVEVGPLPDMLLPNSDCTKVAVACEGEGKMNSDNTLTDPQGSIVVLSITLQGGAPSTTMMSHSLSALYPSQSDFDQEMLDAGVHLPLSKNAMTYWNSHSAISSGLAWDAAIAGYNTATNLEPEYLAWSGDDSKVYVNLQENNAVVVLDIASGTMTISSLGLKSWGPSSDGIDVISDGGACIMEKYDGMETLRQPDSVVAVRVDDQDYLITAEESDDKEYGDYEEKWKLKDAIDKDGIVQTGDLTGFTASAAATTLAQAVHAKQHAANGKESKLRITMGSTAVDYSTPEAPQIKKVMPFGGRGFAVYRVTSAGSLQRVVDSGSTLEKLQCQHFPWAHNAVQDEEFSPVGGTFYNSLQDGSKLKDDILELNQDGCQTGNEYRACPMQETTDGRSPKDGAAAETVAVGVACGRLLAVVTTEKQGTIFVVDITTINSPEVLFVEHLSPAPQTLNPREAYVEGANVGQSTIGEIDPESIIFMDAGHSPSGKVGVFFAGAWSGSVSFWELECPTPEPTPAPTPAPGQAPGQTPGDGTQVNHASMLAPPWASTGGAGLLALVYSLA